MEYKNVFRRSKSESIGNYKVYRDFDEHSSVDILRASIIRSIRTRNTGSQGFHEKRYDGSNNSYTQNHSKKYTVVEVERYDRRGSSFSYDDTESDVSDFEKTTSIDKERIIPSERKTDFHENFNTKDSLCINSFESNEENAITNERNDDWEVIHDNKVEDYRSRANSLKLARRKFSNTIFEDCSTYDITYSNEDLYNENDNSSQKTDSVNIKSSMYSNSVVDDISVVSKEESFLTDGKKSDDQTPLYDTIFSRAIDGEHQSPTLSIHRGKVEKTADNISPVETDIKEIETSTDNVGDNCAPNGLITPTKRKHSRRRRKRSRKKSKSKKPFVYECSKCGVSYVIPTKRMNDIACCLHCDLWTSVEPVFVKREKTSWNNCLIS